MLSIPTLLGVAILTFLMLRVVPGDIVEVKMRGDGIAVSAEALAAERARLGLDQPLVGQFVTWMTGLVQFDLGKSMWTDAPVSQEISLRFGLTFQLAIMSVVIGTLIAMPLGVMAALYRGKVVDYVVRLFATVGMAVPSFWLGMLILLALLSWFGWLPAITFVPIYEDPLTNLSQLIWPSLAVGARLAAVLTRIVRSTVLDVMNEDYIRTARAKGVDERTVVWKHALRNALLPTITVIALEFAFLLGGLVVTEQVFNLNGLGKLFVQSVVRHDFTTIQGMVMLFATAYVVANLVVDILYGLLDPRVRNG